MTRCLIAALLIVPTSLMAQSEDEHALTVYSRAAPGAINPQVFRQQIADPGYRNEIPGYAIVRTRRDMDLDRGRSWQSFVGVAAGIDPSTVSFKSLTDPEGTRVLEQDYRYDLVSTERLLDRFIDQDITVTPLTGENASPISGQLMTSSSGDLILRQDNGELVSVSGGPRQVEFPDLPDGLITRPTLNWLVAADRGGEHNVQVAYETTGMTWWADYNVIYQPGENCRMDLSAWVSLVNQSGASFPGAKLKLIAGEVNRVTPNRDRPQMMMRNQVMAESVEDDGFSEKSLFEYHLYTLSRPIDIPDRALKQVELFPAVANAPCERQLRVRSPLGTYYGPNNPFTSAGYPVNGKQDVEATLTFVNSESANLGMPLPRGRVRVSQMDDADGTMEFIGEDNIDHTPRDEKISLKLGNAFDVVVERTQTDFNWSKGQSWAEEEIEIEIRNRKDEPITIHVEEVLYRWSNWEIIEKSHDFEKVNANRIEFEPTVAANKTAKVIYRVRYSWE